MTVSKKYFCCIYSIIINSYPPIPSLCYNIIYFNRASRPRPNQSKLCKLYSAIKSVIEASRSVIFEVERLHFCDWGLMTFRVRVLHSSTFILAKNCPCMQLTKFNVNSSPGYCHLCWAHVIFDMKHMHLLTRRYNILEFND